MKNVFSNLSDFFYDCEVALADLMDYDNPYWEKGYWQKANEKIFETQAEYMKKIFNL